MLSEQTINAREASLSRRTDLIPGRAADGGNSESGDAAGTSLGFSREFFVWIR